MSQCDERSHRESGSPGGDYPCQYTARYAMELRPHRMWVCGTHRKSLLRQGWKQVVIRTELYFKASVTIESEGNDPIILVTGIEAGITAMLSEYGDHAHVSLSNTRDRTGEA